MRFSLILLVGGVASLAVGLYWVVAGIEEEIIYQRNAAACTTAPNCGTGPPPYGALIDVAIPFILLGTVAIGWGIVRRLQERRGRAVSNGV
jgi:hypothetical protein